MLLTEINKMPFNLFSLTYEKLTVSASIQPYKKAYKPKKDIQDYSEKEPLIDTTHSSYASCTLIPKQFVGPRTYQQIFEKKKNDLINNSTSNPEYTEKLITPRK